MEDSCYTQHSVNTLAHNSTLLFSITIAMYTNQNEHVLPGKKITEKKRLI